MKNIFRFSGVILSILLIHSCKEKPFPPDLSTTEVTAISYTTAISGGKVTNEGGAPVTERGICWGTTADPTITNSKIIERGGLGSFISNITLLTPNTMYFVRAYANNIAGTGYGEQVTFTTLQVAVPVLTTTAITAITQTTAVSGGTITDMKGEYITARGVCWSLVSNPTISDAKSSDGYGMGSYTSNITGLVGNTTYYLRAYATNSVGTAYGNQVSFTTNPLMPFLTTEPTFSDTPTTAISGGNISSDGGAPVTARGVSWSTNPDPITVYNSTSDGSGTGSYVSSITGLTAAVTYYVRAYATNSVGTRYGNTLTLIVQISPTIFNPNLTYGTVTDIEGNVYKTITIGTQTWMAENLKTTRYNDGTAIPNIIDNSAWSALSTGAYNDYSNTPENSTTYGRLYNWYVVDNNTATKVASNGGKSVCPTGWHVPTDAEWTTLTTFLGVVSVAGVKLKETGTTHWATPNTGATNETGFTALPGGHRGLNGTYYNIGYFGYWWSSTEFSPTFARIRLMGGSINTYVSREWDDMRGGSSVRCLRDF